MIDSSLIIKNDYTLQNITVPTLCERFLNRDYKMDTLTDIISRPLSLFIAQNSLQIDIKIMMLVSISEYSHD